jgi:hypothetical protein
VNDPVFGEPAAQIRLELVDDELGQAACCLGSLEEGRPVLLDDPVQERLLGSSTLVAVSPRG